MEKILNDTELNILRESGSISVNEIAYRVGDLIVVENVLTKERRKLDNTNSTFSESHRRLLKG